MLEKVFNVFIFIFQNHFLEEKNENMQCKMRLIFFYFLKYFLEERVKTYNVCETKMFNVFFFVFHLLKKSM